MLPIILTGLLLHAVALTILMRHLRKPSKPTFSETYKDETL